MVRKMVWAICAYFMTLSFLFAGKELALKMGADATFNPVVLVRNPKGGGTATLMHVDGNPFFLTAKHVVLSGEDLWVESEHQPFEIHGVQALIGDMALLFSKDLLPKEFLKSAIDIKSSSPAFSLPQGCIHHNGITQSSNYISLKGFPNIKGYGAGFGAPVLGWQGPIGLLDWKSPPFKNAFAFDLVGLASHSFIREPSQPSYISYDLGDQHTLYYRGNPEQGALSRPLSPGFSGAMVFNRDNQPVGIVTRGLVRPGFPNLVHPNRNLLWTLRQLFGYENLPWSRGPIFNYPIMSRLVHKDTLTAVEPIYPFIEAISLTAQIYYDAL